MGENNTDIFQLFAIFAASLFDSNVAEVMSPYLLIIFAAVTGASWSLIKRESQGKWNSFFYFMRIAFTAILLTTLIATLISNYVSIVNAELLIAPVALLIGVVGDDWIKAFTWILNVVKNAANSIVNKKIGD